MIDKGYKKNILQKDKQGTKSNIGEISGRFFF